MASVSWKSLEGFKLGIVHFFPLQFKVFKVISDKYCLKLILIFMYLKKKTTNQTKKQTKTNWYIKSFWNSNTAENSTQITSSMKYKRIGKVPSSVKIWTMPIYSVYFIYIYMYMCIIICSVFELVRAWVNLNF